MDVVMDSALWQTLPKELLYLVFARLPVSGISCLRLLSKDWKKAVETPGSEFTRVLDETGYPRMFGLVYWKDKLNLDGFCGRVFDVKSNRWHEVPVDAGYSDYVVAVGAADGGLVCFVSETTEAPMFMIVQNPLTGKKARLPSLLGMDGAQEAVQPTMAQLIMDGEKQHYKVFAAGYRYMDSGDRHPFAQVYDSRTKGWTVVGSEQRSWDHIAGIKYVWEHEGNYYSGMRFGPCVYDFAEGRLLDFGKQDIVSTSTHAVLKNRLFVGQMQARAGPANSDPANDSELCPSYCISEYNFQKNAHSWMDVGTHDCSPFSEYYFEKGYRQTKSSRPVIFACNRFLMVLPDYSDFDGGWMYDLSTREWRKLPGFPDQYQNGPVNICELR